MCPTIVNNVETLCAVKHIIAMGGAKYAQLGRPNNTGTRIVCVSGDVERPGYFEIEVGKVTMGQLIYEMAGGIKWGRRLKAVIPGGSSAKVYARTSGSNSNKSSQMDRQSKQTCRSMSCRWILIRLRPPARWLGPAA